jgi:hypothetical protein
MIHMSPYYATQITIDNLAKKQITIDKYIDLKYFSEKKYRPQISLATLSP